PLSFSMIPPPPSPTLFPYTTLFRSALLDHSRYFGQSLLAAAEYRGHDGDVYIPLISFYRTPGDHIVDGSFSQVNYRHRPRPYRKDRKSTRLNSSHVKISYAVFCLKK